MELKLEIKLASTEELASIAKALSGMTVTSSADRQVGTTTAVSQSQNKEEVEESEEMEDVPSPYTAHPSEVKADKPAPAKQTAADKKAQKEAEKEAKRQKDEQDKADRIARLKADMEKQQAQVVNTPPPVVPSETQQESNEAIVAEIQALGDALMGFQGMPLEAKQKLTGDIITKLGVQGVRPTQLQQPLLGQFRDMYRSAVNSVINPVMGGLV